MEILLSMFGLLILLFVAYCYGYSEGVKSSSQPLSHYCIDRKHHFVLTDCPNGKLHCQRCGFIQD
jgi:hypothetical protein